MLKILAFAAALVIVGLGGWIMYKKNNPASTEQTADTAILQSRIQQAPVTDSCSISSSRKKILQKLRQTDSVSPVNHQRTGTCQL